MFLRKRTAFQPAIVYKHWQHIREFITRDCWIV